MELVLSLLEPGQVRDRTMWSWCRHCSPVRAEGQDCVELVPSLLEPGQVRDRTVWSWCCHCWSPDR